MTLLLAFTFVLVIGVCLGRLLMLRRARSQPALLFTVAAMAAGICFTVELSSAAVDDAIGIVNVSDLINTWLSLFIMAPALLFRMTLDEPHRVPRRAITVAATFTAAMFVLIGMNWAASPVHRVETPNDAGAWLTSTGPFGFVATLYYVYVVAAFGALAWQCTFGDARTRFSRMPIPRIGSGLMGIGLGMIGLGQGLLFTRSLAAHRNYVQLTQAYWVLTVIQTSLIVIGLFLPRATRSLQQVHEERDRRTRLEPIWQHLTSLFPEVYLPTRRARSAGQLKVVTTRLFVEVSDCLDRFAVPVEAVSRICAADTPVVPLAGYLAACTQPPETASDSHFALGLLPPATTPQADELRILDLADAFTSIRSRSTESAPPSAAAA